VSSQNLILEGGFGRGGVAGQEVLPLLTRVPLTPKLAVKAVMAFRAQSHTVTDDMAPALVPMVTVQMMGIKPTTPLSAALTSESIALENSPAPFFICGQNLPPLCAANPVGIVLSGF
jgi:hypothetical protein